VNLKEISNVIPLRAPRPVGVYIVGESFYIEMFRKPNWFHRLMMYLWFGWIWSDYEMRTTYIDGPSGPKGGGRAA